MFGSRSVNLGGSSNASTRTATLERTRLERQERQINKQRQQAATKIQAFVRAQHEIRRLRQQSRNFFDETIKLTLQQYKQSTKNGITNENSNSNMIDINNNVNNHNTTPPLLALVSLIRHFLFFTSSHDWRTGSPNRPSIPTPQESKSSPYPTARVATAAEDRERWVQLQQLLILSLKNATHSSPFPIHASLDSSSSNLLSRFYPFPPLPLYHHSSHYAALLLLSNSTRATFLFQSRRLTTLLCDDIAAASTLSSSHLFTSSFLLFLLTTPKQWPIMPTLANLSKLYTLPTAEPNSSSASPSPALLLEQIQTTVMQNVDLNIISPLVSPRTTLLPFSDNSAAVLSLLFHPSTPHQSWHSAIRQAVLFLTSTPIADQNNTIAVLILLALNSPTESYYKLNDSIKLKSDAVRANSSISYFIHILSIPYLFNRLDRIRLSSLAAKWLDPALVQRICKNILQTSDSISSNVLLDRYIKALPSHPIDSSLTPASSASLAATSRSDQLSSAKLPSNIDPVPSKPAGDNFAPENDLMMNGDNDHDAEESEMEDDDDEKEKSNAPGLPNQAKSLSGSAWTALNLCDFLSRLSRSSSRSSSVDVPSLPPPVLPLLPVLSRLLRQVKLEEESEEIKKRERLPDFFLDRLSVLGWPTHLSPLLSFLEQFNSPKNPNTKSPTNLPASTIISSPLELLTQMSSLLHSLLTLSPSLRPSLLSSLTMGRMSGQLSSPLLRAIFSIFLSLSSTSTVLFTDSNIISLLLPLFCDLFSSSLVQLSGEEIKSTPESESVWVGSVVRWLVNYYSSTIGVKEAITASSASLISGGASFTSAAAATPTHPDNRRIVRIIRSLRCLVASTDFSVPANSFLNPLVTLEQVENERKHQDANAPSPTLPDSEIPFRSSQRLTGTRLKFRSSLKATYPYISLLRHIPYVLSFDDRVRFLYSHVEEDRNSFASQTGAGHRCVIRRAHLLEDGFTKLSGLGNDLKGRILIEFVDEHGIAEAGVGPGLFREFVSLLIQVACEEKWGLFTSTPNSQAFPAPNARRIIQAPKSLLDSTSMIDQDGEEDIVSFQTTDVYYWLGQMLGKMIWDGLQCQPTFATFFLMQLLAQKPQPAHLYSFDTQFAHSLHSLTKMSAEQLKEIDLTFTAASSSSFNGSIELIERGAQIPVTPQNVHSYVQAMSSYKLEGSISWQVDSIRNGLLSVLSSSLLYLFDVSELSLLLSGTSTPFDVDELRRHTNYTGGYSDSHECIRWFWQVLHSFTPEQRSQFLLFVTSVPRSPVLGFNSLQPHFAIQRVDCHEDQLQLPTTATCLHILRLPRYSSIEVLRERLTYAITHAVGFGLT